LAKPFTPSTIGSRAARERAFTRHSWRCGGRAGGDFPLYKQRIRLRDGCQVENGEPAVRAWPVKIENGKVWVGNDALVMRAEAS
jgi:hypothetical protein